MQVVSNEYKFYCCKIKSKYPKKYLKIFKQLFLCRKLHEQKKILWFIFKVKLIYQIL